MQIESRICRFNIWTDWTLLCQDLKPPCLTGWQGSRRLAFWRCIPVCLPDATRCFCCATVAWI